MYKAPLNREKNKKQVSLPGMLISLTVLFLCGQISSFFVHYKVSALIDALANTSIANQISHSFIFLPLLVFIAIQLIAYVLFVSWVWFISVSCGEKLKLSNIATYWLGIACWVSACSVMLALNRYYYPDSFFATPITKIAFLNYLSPIIVVVTSLLLIVTTIIAYANFFLHRRHTFLGSLFMMMVIGVGAIDGYNKWVSSPAISAGLGSKPDIIFIGLDSLRPDFTGYYGNKITRTPNIDHFLETAATFANAYSPLARTFSSWVSILTAKYPLHNHARVNLADPASIIVNDTLAKKLKAAGYRTIYATDETSFSNITKEYGFDRIIAPKTGAVEFILSGVTDFPLTNLLINLPFGEYLFPYNYGNRSSAITYRPDNFLQLMKSGLANRSPQPTFLAVHLCLAHWPFTWARDGQREHISYPDKYRSSVEAVDHQLGRLLQILQANGLLKNSLVVLLSDHGTTLGLPNDRVITRKKYIGDIDKLKAMTVMKLSSAPEHSLNFKKDYTINTSYGQGTDLLSLKQNHVLLAFKRFAPQQTKQDVLPHHDVTIQSSLLDIAPTILAFLNLPPLQQVDGVSLRDNLFSINDQPLPGRLFFMETGDSMSEIETDHIRVDKVIKKGIGVYRINPANGFIFLTPTAEKAVIANKQHSIMLDDWLLVRYSAHLQTKLVRDAKKMSQYTMKPVIIAPYYVLANLKTGQWTIGSSTQFAQASPFADLKKKLEGFYGDEVMEKAKVP